MFTVNYDSLIEALSNRSRYVVAAYIDARASKHLSSPSTL